MSENQGDKVTCSHCQRKVVPKLSFENGVPDKSWCPLCGHVVEDFYAGGEFGLILIILAGVVAYYFWP